ncbi:MAG: energy transducer TonB [Bacteroidia bacterium]
MKYLLVILMLFSLIYVVDANAQEKKSTDEVYYKVDVMPEFPGGMDDLSYFFYTHLKYPDDAKKDKIEGIVYVGFIVDEIGKVKNVKVIKGVHPSLDKEALRVATQMPKWTPGKHNGKNVKVQFNLPVKFALEDKN